MTEPPAEAPTDAAQGLDQGCPDQGYRVLARKYRPSAFDQLIGQDGLVRTLTNAIKGGRLAQAYMLTGVRGVGKTTTARLIARALNCIGPDGTGGVTIEPCGVCEACRAIMEDRHVDVLEMDAASRTGVGDIREILDGVRYRPTAARYKVYIIDEVHMLSTQAFNALLKTLEEPPEHVKFVFATTEIRKVPVTVLSRCQRFDLRRVEQSELADHFARIAEREGSTVEPGALTLIARAADGSVRDGLSLLDQAIAHGDGVVTEAQARDMLGLADRTAVFDLFESVMKGDIGPALEALAAQYALGADPLVIMQDLLDLTHWLTRLKVVPVRDDDPLVPEAERTRGQALAQGLSVASLTRAWQMLLKGLGEGRASHDPLQAVEMALIRLAYAAELPTPAETVARLMGSGSGGGGGGGGGGAPGGGGGGGGGAQASAAATASASTSARQPGASGSGAPQASARADGGGTVISMAQARPAPAPDPAPAPETPSPPMAAPNSFRAVADLLRDRREARLAKHLVRDVRLVRFEPGRIEFNPGPDAPRDLAGRLGRVLQDFTGRRWVVMVSDQAGEPTLHEQTQASVLSDPLVRSVMDTFPGATIGIVRERATEAGGPDGTGPGSEETAGAMDADDATDMMPTGDDAADAFGAFDDGFGDDGFGEDDA